jgi:hypothetical protein
MPKICGFHRSDYEQHLSSGIWYSVLSWRGTKILKEFELLIIFNQSINQELQSSLWQCQAGRSRVRVPMRWIFSIYLILSSCTMALGSTQPLTEMSTRNIPGGEGQPACKTDNLTAICEPIVYKNVGASTSHSPMGLHGPLQGYLYLPLPYGNVYVW